jgi:hypothetical protein
MMFVLSKYHLRFASMFLYVSSAYLPQNRKLYGGLSKEGVLAT